MDFGKNFIHFKREHFPVCENSVIVMADSYLVHVSTNFRQEC